MPEATSKRSNITQFLLIFAVVYIGSQFMIRYWFPSKPAPTGVIELTSSATFREGVTPTVTLVNHTATGFTLPARCPMPPLDVARIADDGTAIPLALSGTALAVDCPPALTIPAGASSAVHLDAWKNALFRTKQKYQVSVPSTLLPKLTGSGANAPQNVSSVRFEVTEPGTFTKLFRAFITKPFLNFLIFAASFIPGHNLGLAIILLTLIVKLLLFWPTQRAMESQKKMQMLQPKLAELKKKYPDDPKRQQEETMKLWKEHGVNPFGACLPTLIQLPILIGLFYVVRDGTHLELSKHLIYSFYQHLDWTFGTGFLWLNLLKTDPFFIMPVLLFVLQFLQMKMTFAIQKRKSVKEGKEQKENSQQDMQQTMMQYIFPIMIGFFALQVPAAVSLYWGISTLFAIAQQAIVNREHLKV